MSLTLYFHPLSSFCWKTLIALYENETPFTPHMLRADNEADRAGLLELWPVGKFPVLRDGARDQIIPETTIIIEYLDRYYPGRTRFIPADPDPTATQGIEFHVRVVPGGLVSTAIVGETQPGDRWRLSSPHGGLQVDRDGPDVLMVAGSTGLAPLRALIMDLSRFAANPRVHLFFGARYRCELYDLPTLWQIASHNPWLSVTPVAELNGDPAWAADYPDVTPPRGLHLRQTGKLMDVVTRYGNWGDRQILICGGPEMVRATKAALIAKGAPPERIQHDPLSS